MKESHFVVSVKTWLHQDERVCGSMPDIIIANSSAYPLTLKPFRCWFFRSSSTAIFLNRGGNTPSYGVPLHTLLLMRVLLTEGKMNLLVRSSLANICVESLSLRLQRISTTYSMCTLFNESCHGNLFLTLSFFKVPYQGSKKDLGWSALGERIFDATDWRRKWFDHIWWWRIISSIQSAKEVRVRF